MQLGGLGEDAAKSVEKVFTPYAIPSFKDSSKNFDAWKAPEIKTLYINLLKKQNTLAQPLITANKDKKAVNFADELIRYLNDIEYYKSVLLSFYNPDVKKSDKATSVKALIKKLSGEEDFFKKLPDKIYANLTVKAQLNHAEKMLASVEPESVITQEAIVKPLINVADEDDMEIVESKTPEKQSNFLKFLPVVATGVALLFK